MSQTIIDPWVALVWKIVRPISRSSGLPVDRISSIPHQDGWSVRVEWPLLAYVLDVYSSPDRTVTDARASMLRYCDLRSRLIEAQVAQVPPTKDKAKP